MYYLHNSILYLFIYAAVVKVCKIDTQQTDLKVHQFVIIADAGLLKLLIKVLEREEGLLAIGISSAQITKDNVEIAQLLQLHGQVINSYAV